MKHFLVYGPILERTGQNPSSLVQIWSRTGPNLGSGPDFDQIWSKSVENSDFDQFSTESDHKPETISQHLILGIGLYTRKRFGCERIYSIPQRTRILTEETSADERDFLFNPEGTVQSRKNRSIRARTLVKTELTGPKI